MPRQGTNSRSSFLGGPGNPNDPGLDPYGNPLPDPNAPPDPNLNNPPPGGGGPGRGDPQKGGPNVQPRIDNTPRAADLSSYRQAQTGNFPNSFVNLQAYLNANQGSAPTPGSPAPGYTYSPTAGTSGPTTTAPVGSYTQGQSNLDTMLRSAYYGPQSVGPPGFQPTAQAAGGISPTAVAQGAQGAMPSGGPTGAQPQPGLANQQPGSLSGGQTQATGNVAPGTTYQSDMQKDRLFPRLQKYLG
jgi:hypothetical protein